MPNGRQSNQHYHIVVTGILMLDHLVSGHSCCHGWSAAGGIIWVRVDVNRFRRHTIHRLAHDWMAARCSKAMNAVSASFIL